MSNMRVNLNLPVELIETLDAYAAANGRTRTHVLCELLMPAIPTLKYLLAASEKLKHMTDAEKIIALSGIETDVTSLTNEMLKPKSDDDAS